MSLGVIDCSDQEARSFSPRPAVASRGTQNTIITAVTLVSIGVVFIPLDVHISQWLAPEHVFGELKVFLNRIEPFGHAYGVLLIPLTLMLAGLIDRKKFAMVFCCGIGSGLFADVIKTLVCRVRPKDLQSIEAPGHFAGFPAVGDTYSWSHLFETSHRSFPSAHTATAFGMAVALSALYPKGQRCFFTLAGLVALQRIVHGYHFPSDTLVGAAIGIVLGRLVVSRFLRDSAASETTGSAQNGSLNDQLM